ncbi:phospholipase A and acyltransferase 4-like [Toxotes jaculatrix]|uniref:phospholipase A and acyltransferase 4-like n=1 Tax=Toxotes jaculatrix TaxID=941984 RepID=UPI001B3A9006|nr:phospholipase A and acyltransferase 4-like [Toxotes jaculatrix]
MEPEPQPGDLIEIFRVGYQHWAVYVGDGYVVHFANISGSSGINLGQACSGKVKKRKLRHVVQNSRWQINNKLDTTHKPRPAQQIVKEALSYVGKKMIYSVHLRNCEHFATELRYGKAMSLQVIKVASAAGAAVAGAVIAGPAVAAAAAITALLVVKNSASMSTSSSS